jgi:hypothetical protein
VQERRLQTLSGIPEAILRMAWAPSGVEGIHHCQAVATSSHNHYQHLVGHHLCRQENRISACLLHVLLDDAWEILCGETPFPVGKQSSHLAVLEQERMTLIEDGPECGVRGSVKGNETSRNEKNGALHDLQNTP